MSTSELKEFKNKLKKDSEFKTQVDTIKTILLGIEAQSLKEKLENFHNEIDNKQDPFKKGKTIKVNFFTFRKIAVAAIFIIAVGGYWFLNQNSNDNLYAKHFKVDPGLPTTMGDTSNYKFYDGMVNYKRGDYKLAIEKWEPLLSQKSKNDTLNYFIGVAYLANKNELGSISYLETVVRQKNNVFKNEAYYYLGLAYLKTGNIKLAKENFSLSTIDNSKDIISKISH